MPDPPIGSKRRTCESCANCAKHTPSNMHCRRERPPKYDRVRGETRTYVTCEYERSNYPRWFGGDTCGKEGKYWKRASTIVEVPREGVADVKPKPTLTKQKESNMPDFRVPLGVTARHIISDMQGITVARCQYLTGCNQVAIQPVGVDKDLQPYKAVYFDEPFVEILNATVLQPVVPRGADDGCDIAAPPSR